MQWLRERDIDLLVCSELQSDGPLRELLLGEWNNGIAELDDAWVSVNDYDGETDIVVSFVSGGDYLVLLVEDKIGADFQPGQPERYRKRADRWGASLSPRSAVETVLLAPDEYFENEGCETFDRLLSYQEVIDALSGSSDPRSLFLARALENGIEYHEQGHRAQPSENMTQVWADVWEMANSLVPALHMKKPGGKPSKSSFVYFPDAHGVSKAETLGKATIVYKLRHGNVDLQFGNTTVETLRNVIGDHLDEDMIFARANKSASVRIRVPSVDAEADSKEQEEALGEGLLAAERLRLFFIGKGLLNHLPHG